MKNRTLTVILLVIMLVGLFSACGTNPAASGPSESPAASDGDAGISEPPAEEPVTITILYSGTSYENDFELEVMPKLIKEKYPHITIEATKLPDDQYYTTLRTKLTSGEGPDMFLVQPKYAGINSVIGLAQAGYLEPQNDLECVALSSQAGLDAFSYDGNIYAVPGGVAILGTYYNKVIFDQYELSVPTTWDQFLEVCQTLQDNGVQPIVMGDKDMYVMQFGLYQLAASEIYANNPQYDDQLRTGETKFTDPGTWDKVMEMYTTLYDKGYISSSSLGLGAQQAIQMFIDGEAAMTFDGSFNVNALRAQGAAEVELGYFPIPGTTDTYASIAPGACLAIYSGSKYKEECRLILDYWLDGESELWREYADNGRNILTYGYGADKIDPLFQPFMDLYNEGKAFYWCNQAWPAGTENEMEAKLSEYIGGQGTTVADIVNAMQAKFDDLLTE